MLAASIIGLLLNLAGTTLAGSALRDDWRDNAGGRPLVPWFAQAKAWILRIIRRSEPRSVTLVGEGASAGMVALGGRVRVIPARGAPVDEQIDYLRDEVEALHARVDSDSNASRARLREIESALAEAQRAAAAETLRVEKLARDNATNSVQKQLWGLLLIGVGSVLSVVPAIHGA